MANELGQSGGDIIAIIHGGTPGSLPSPFQNEILLFETHIAGTTHIENADMVMNALECGQKVHFFREIHNPYDSEAIKIENANREKLGYIPSRDNLVFARLMDAGKILFGKILSKQKQGNWWKVIIEVYLLD